MMTDSSLPARSTGLPPFEVPGLLDDGTLPIALRGQDLIVEIPLPDHADPLTDRLDLMWNDKPLGVQVPIDGTSMIQRLILPQALLQAEGRHTLDYVIYHGFGGNPLKAEQARPVIVDLTAPGSNNLGALLFAAEHYQGVIEQNLVDGALRAFVPGWISQQVGDVATPWVAKGRYPAPADFIELSAYEQVVKEAGGRLILNIAQHELKALGDGWISFSYKVRDKAGNRRSNLAFSAPLNVLLNEAPGNLRPPRVPAFDDGLVTWDDARTGVPVSIPGYDNASPGDVIGVAWGDQNAVVLTLGPKPVGGYPDPLMNVPVPRSLVQLQGNGSVAVTFCVMRNGVHVGPSPATVVEVDLRTPGGVDPDPLTPEHDNLQAPQVFSHSGVRDEIPAGDYGADAVMVIPRLDAAGVAVWQDGDELEIHWAGITLGRRIAGDNSDIRFVIDHGQVIEPAPTGPVSVFYRIKRPLGGGHYGVAQSPAVQVRVVSLAALPGGVAGVPLANYPEAFISLGHWVINKAASVDGTFIRVPLVRPGPSAAPLENVAVGDHVSVRFVAVNHLTDPAAAEIPATEVIVTRTLKHEDLAAGYWDAPITEDQLKAICSLTANSYITLTNATGSATSPRSPVIVSVRVLGYCTIPTV